jgi:hypothetical protein
VRKTCGHNTHSFKCVEEAVMHQADTIVPVTGGRLCADLIEKHKKWLVHHSACAPVILMAEMLAREGSCPSVVTTWKRSDS